MIDGTDIETPSPQFVRQLAVVLSDARRRRHLPVRWLARRSHGRFTWRELERVEAGRMRLDAGIVVELAWLYGVDVEGLLPDRRPDLEIRPDGLIRCGQLAAEFTPGDDASLVSAYFRLTRQLRRLEDHETMPLRRNDLVAINEFLQGTRAASKYLDAVLAASLAEQRVVTGSLIAGAVSLGLAGLTEHSSPATATADGRTSAS